MTGLIKRVTARYLQQIPVTYPASRMATQGSQLALFEFAEALIQDGHDRIRFRFDKRREDTFRRKGLLAYPDGTYSVRKEVMEKAVEWWRSLSLEGGSEERREVLLNLVREGTGWLARYRSPDVRKLRFGDLNYSQYLPLWEMVTSWSATLWLDAATTSKRELAFWEAHAKKGYVEIITRGSSLQVLATPAGKHLVSSLGSPSMLAAVESFNG